MKELVSKKEKSAQKKNQKKDGFRRHSVLVDSKRKAVIKTLLTKSKKSKPSLKTTAAVPISANPYSKIKNLPHDLQNQLADNIYSVYAENDEKARTTSNVAWGAGLFIPAAIETAGFVAGFNFDIPTAILANIIFAALFRFSVGNSMVKPNQEMATKKAKQAAHLLNSGKINSEYAQTKLIGIVHMEDIYSILESDNIRSEEAQLQLVDRASHTFNSTQLSRLLKKSLIKGRARNVLSNLAGRT